MKTQICRFKAELAKAFAQIDAEHVELFLVPATSGVGNWANHFEANPTQTTITGHLDQHRVLVGRRTGLVVKPT